MSVSLSSFEDLHFISMALIPALDERVQHTIPGESPTRFGLFVSYWQRSGQGKSVFGWNQRWSFWGAYLELSYRASNWLKSAGLLTNWGGGYRRNILHDSDWTRTSQTWVGLWWHVENFKSNSTDKLTSLMACVAPQDLQCNKCQTYIARILTRTDPSTGRY